MNRDGGLHTCYHCQRCCPRPHQSSPVVRLALLLAAGVSQILHLRGRSGTRAEVRRYIHGVERGERTCPPGCQWYFWSFVLAALVTSRPRQSRSLNMPRLQFDWELGGWAQQRRCFQAQSVSWTGRPSMYELEGPPASRLSDTGSRGLGRTRICLLLACYGVVHRRTAPPRKQCVFKTALRASHLE